jgi:hypothetical protein
MFSSKGRLIREASSTRDTLQEELSSSHQTKRIPFGKGAKMEE